MLLLLLEVDDDDDDEDEVMLLFNLLSILKSMKLSSSSLFPSSPPIPFTFSIVVFFVKLVDKPTIADAASTSSATRLSRARVRNRV